MMEKHKCESCGTLFDTPAYGKEDLGECHGDPSYTRYSMCPACGSADFFSVEQCVGCGGWFFSSLAGGYCESCGEGIQQRFLAELAQLAQGYNSGERKYLQAMLGNNSDLPYRARESI